MGSMEWVEVRGRTVDEAVAAGLQELGLDSPDAAEVEVLQQPQRGFLGIGGQDALVRIKARPKQRRRHRRSRSGGAPSEGGGPKGEPRSGGGPRGQGRSQRQGGERRDGRRSRPAEAGRRGEGPNRGGRGPRSSGGRRPAEPAAAPSPALDIEAQARIVEDFLRGLLGAFGLDGEVAMRIEDDIIYADLSGDQTEALVGPKGVVLDAVLELCRTMVHRHTLTGARLRLDIAGYGERRREALRIYAQRLASKVLEEGGEVMLEPMNPADRKVVHDTIATIEGVRSFSEGEDPERSVVIAPADEG